MRTYALVVLAGCSVPPPFYGLEPPSTLPSGHVSIMAGGGGGSSIHGGTAGGGAARVRVGIGGNQELGLDVDAVSSGDAPYDGAKLAYKIAPTDGFALTAGGGAVYHGDSGRNATVGGDLGASLRLGTYEGADFYGGAKVGVAVPVGGSDRYALGGISETVTIPLGVSMPLSHDGEWHAVAELGGLTGLYQHRNMTTGPIQTDDFLAGYGALAVVWAH